MAGVLAVALLVLGLFGTSAASTVIETDFATLTRESDVIFAGTVQGLHAQWTDDRRSIVTKLRFANASVIKGSIDPGSIEVTIKGGRVGADVMGVDGMPEFKQGERYVLLCESADLGSSRNSYIPISGLYLGYFRLAPDNRSSTSSVHDHAERPVIGVEGGRLVVLDSPSQPEGSASGGSPRVVDLDYTPSRAEIARRDSENRPGSTPVVRSVPTRRPRASSATGRVQRESDSQEGTSGRTAVVGSGRKVLPRAQDPGIRLSEQEFIRLIGRLLR